jgi:hypothetical protein
MHNQGFFDAYGSDRHKNAQHRLHRTSAGVARTSADSAPKAGSPFGFFPPNPALASKTCRSATPRQNLCYLSNSEREIL